MFKFIAIALTIITIIFSSAVSLADTYAYANPYINPQIMNIAVCAQTGKLSLQECIAAHTPNPAYTSVEATFTINPYSNSYTDCTEYFVSLDNAIVTMDYSGVATVNVTYNPQLNENTGNAILACRG